MPDHSPGIWKLCAHLRTPPVDCSCGYQGGIWSADGNKIICEMGPHGSGAEMIDRPDEDTQRANARLIAAAPTMFQALATVMSLPSVATPDEIELIHETAKAALNLAINGDVAGWEEQNKELNTWRRILNA